MDRAHQAHYWALGPKETGELVRALYDTTRRAVVSRRADELLAHADLIAEERFNGGFDLFEVQMAFNALEEAFWMEVLDQLAPSQQPEALGLISTALGIGKDALARGFLARATRSPAPSVDLRSLFQSL